MSVELLRKNTRIDPTDRNAIKRRFMLINRERLRRVQASLRDRKEDFLDLLPLLFHLNHPMLPGYMSNASPAGISDYSPENRSIEAAKRLSKSFTYKRQALRQYDIHAIYLMGSSGTIAYSSNSDFDIWVCHRPGLDEDQLAMLRRKAEGISSWAASLGLEVHFFVLNDESFRDGAHQELSHESSGSSQHQILVEEFYRTGLLVAGRYPIWWLVPPDQEANYDAYVHELKHKRFIKDNESLDFGSVNDLSAGEFFGAALWQLYKAVESPYKSVLKIMLMEAYSAEYPEVEVLSKRYKRAVYEGETHLDNLDPYVLMCNKVEEYLLSQEDYERQEVARRCFYFKVDERMSRKDTLRNANWRREAMRDLVNQWGWSQAHLTNLDARSGWKIHRVLEERKVLVDALTTSYKSLSRFARENADSVHIDPADIHLLGRKLYTAFERKAGKIEIINPGISTDLREDRLSLHHARSGDGGWVLYRDLVTEDEVSKHEPIKRAHSLLEVLAWCHFNRLLNPVTTMLSIFPAEEAADPWEIRSVLECLDQLFPQAELPQGDMRELAQAASVRSAGLFINLGSDPLARHTSKGQHLITSRTDALRYGGQWENLANSFDQIIVTSWQEVLTSKYRGDNALMDCLCDYLAWSPVSSATPPPPIPCYSFSSTRGPAIARRIEELYNAVIDCYYHGEDCGNARYVLHAGQYYYVLQPENDSPRYQRLDSYPALLRYLGNPQEEFSRAVIDRHTLLETPLSMIFQVNRRNIVQLFYQVNGSKADIYVLDEKGSLFQQRIQFHDKFTLLAQFQRFLESVQPRCAAIAGTTLDIEYYQIIRDGASKFSVQSQHIQPLQRSHAYLGIQVIGDVLENGDTVFTMYCGKREFSTQEYGEDLFRHVANYVLAQRSSGSNYPIYITDIDLSKGLLGADAVHGLQTVHLLTYKQRIESHLNKELSGE